MLFILRQNAVCSITLAMKDCIEDDKQDLFIYSSIVMITFQIIDVWLRTFMFDSEWEVWPDHRAELDTATTT